MTDKQTLKKTEPQTVTITDRYRVGTCRVDSCVLQVLPDTEAVLVDGKPYIDSTGRSVLSYVFEVYGLSRYNDSTYELKTIDGDHLNCTVSNCTATKKDDK